MFDSDDLEKAKELIKYKKISRIVDKNVDLQDHFQVVGSKEERYLVVLPNFCTCMHFHINCVKEPNKVCKHIFACTMVGSNIPNIEVENWQDLLFEDFDDLKLGIDD